MTNRLWRIGLPLAILIAGTAPLAVAATFSVSGSSNPSAYRVFTDAYQNPQDDKGVKPIPVTRPAGPWVKGMWMSYNNGNQTWPMETGSGNLPGSYQYVTNFDLTGFDPATAVLKGSWASDNNSELYLNGDHLIGSITGQDSSFNHLTYFDITEGFIEGLNFLEFVVTNEPWGEGSGINPTGLLVNIYEATANPVPEPATALLVAGGILGVALVRRRSCGR